MAEYRSARRYYLSKRQYARSLDNDQDGIWRSKQEAEAGTPLPAGFPLLERLAECGYTAVEDLDGADENELVTVAGFRSREAKEVLAALAAL